MNWPEDDKPAAFDDLIDPLVRAFNAGATWRTKPSMLPHDIEWTGLPLPETMLLSSAENRLSADWRENDRDQGRTFLDTVISLAVNFGMEQGRRVERERQQTSRRALRVAVNTLDYVLETWDKDGEAGDRRLDRLTKEIDAAELEIAKRDAEGYSLTPDRRATGIRGTL